MEILRFGVGNRRPDGPPCTSGVAGQRVHSDARGGSDPASGSAPGARADGGLANPLPDAARAARAAAEGEPL